MTETALPPDLHRLKLTIDRYVVRLPDIIHSITPLSTMGAGASAVEHEQMCFGYWDTSTNSIHMVRLNTQTSHEPCVTSAIVEEDEESKHTDKDTSTSSSYSCSLSSGSDNDKDNASLLSSASTKNTPKGWKKCSRRLSDVNTVSQRLKLRRVGGYTELPCRSDDNKDRRVSHIELQELESVTMPMKAAKLLIGNPMKVNSHNPTCYGSDDEESLSASANSNFDIVSVGNRVAHMLPRSPRVTQLPPIQSPRQLTTQKCRMATLLTTADTQITMVMPRKAAQLLLGEPQRRSSTIDMPSDGSRATQLTGKQLIVLFSC